MIPQLYECFKHWSNLGSVYVLSDTHFDDEDRSLMDPDWISSSEQVRQINKTITNNDTLILLGDIGDPKYVRQCRGRYKILIMGNHDAGASKYTEYFAEIYSGPVFVGQRLLLSHEPVQGLTYCLNIHGHEHSCDTIDKFHLNVCANVCNYTPVNLGSILNNGILADIPDIHRVAIDGQKKKNQIAKESTGNQVEGLSVFYTGKYELSESGRILMREEGKVCTHAIIEKYGG